MKKCQICGKIGPTMFITQIVKGEVTELHLCEDCARERGLLDPLTLSFNEKFFPENFQEQIEQLMKKVEQDVAALNQLEDSDYEFEEIDDPAMICPICQYTLAQFRQSDRVGCPDCYRVFAEHLGMRAAEGLDAEPISTPLSPQLLLKNLERQMARAIELEEYEEAAIIRDQIKNLQEEA